VSTKPYNGREVEVTAYLGVLSSEGNDPWYEVRAPWIREINRSASTQSIWPKSYLRKRPQPPDWSEIAHRNSMACRKLGARHSSAATAQRPRGLTERSRSSGEIERLHGANACW